MKKIITIPFLLLPIVAIAQDIPNMGANVMLQMQQMASCMERIDQSALQAFEQRAKQMDNEVNALCASGKRDEAQRKAISFVKEVEKSAALQEIKKCGEMIKVTGMPAPKVPDEEDYSKHHACDSDS